MATTSSSTSRLQNVSKMTIVCLCLGVTALVLQTVAVTTNSWMIVSVDFVFGVKMNVGLWKTCLCIDLSEACRCEAIEGGVDLFHVALVGAIVVIMLTVTLELMDACMEPSDKRQIIKQLSALFAAVAIFMGMFYFGTTYKKIYDESTISSAISVARNDLDTTATIGWSYILSILADVAIGATVVAYTVGRCRNKPSVPRMDIQYQYTATPVQHGALAMVPGEAPPVNCPVNPAGPVPDYRGPVYPTKQSGPYPVQKTQI